MEAEAFQPTHQKLPPVLSHCSCFRAAGVPQPISGALVPSGLFAKLATAQDRR